MNASETDGLFRWHLCLKLSQVRRQLSRAGAAAVSLGWRYFALGRTFSTLPLASVAVKLPSAPGALSV